MEVDFDQIDDPVFDTGSARVQGRTFILDGVVSLQGGRVMSDRRPKTAMSWFARLAWREHRVEARIENVINFRVDDEAGTGQLILEHIEHRDYEMLLSGVIPCLIRVALDSPSRLQLFVDEKPLPSSGGHER